MIHGNIDCLSESFLFQIANQLNIEFTDIKTVQIFPVQVNHISVRNAAFLWYGEQLKTAAPRKGFFSDKPIVFSVKQMNETVSHIQWKLSG